MTGCGHDSYYQVLLSSTGQLDCKRYQVIYRHLDDLPDWAWVGSGLKKLRALRRLGFYGLEPMRLEAF